MRGGTMGKLSVLVLLLTATGAGAQDTRAAYRDSILQELRHRANGGHAAVTLLRATGTGHEPAVQQAFVDSLLAVYDGAREKSALDTRVRGEILLALASAAVADGPGTPSSEAGDALYRLALAGSGGAAYAVSQRADRAAALRDLRALATSAGNVSSVAVRHLASTMGPDGVAVLRELYLGDAVSNAWARRSLSAVARDRGWKRPDPRT